MVGPGTSEGEVPRPRQSRLQETGREGLSGRRTREQFAGERVPVQTPCLKAELAGLDSPQPLNRRRSSHSVLGLSWGEALEGGLMGLKSRNKGKRGDE